MKNALLDLYERLAEDKDRVYVLFQGQRYVNGSSELFEAIKKHIGEK